MLEILFWLFLFIIVFPLWLLSFVLGKIAYKIAGKKGRNIAYFISLGMPFILFLGFVIYNIVEYYYIKNQVKNICEKEAGIFVYVTPEQWREENKDEWETLYSYHGLKDKDKIREMENKYKELFIDDVKLTISSVKNKKIISYWDITDISNYIRKTTRVFVDIDKNRILFKQIYFGAGVGGTGIFASSNPKAWKFWINSIPDYCQEYENTDIGNSYLDNF